MVKLADILNEVSALEASLEKVASEKTNGESLASVLDKIAMDAEEGYFGKKDEDEEDEDKDKEDEEEAEKEGSMKPGDIQKIAHAVIAELNKIAVLSNEQTQGSTLENAGPDGKATIEARKHDQCIPASSVESAAASNPSAHQSGADSARPIDKAAPMQDGIHYEVGGAGVNKSEQKVSHVTYSTQEAEVLQKLASIGYEAIVEHQANQLVQEKVAEAYLAEQAKEAPQKIARHILKNQRRTTEKTASQRDREKLASIRQNDPQLFSALQILAHRKLI